MLQGKFLRENVKYRKNCLTYTHSFSFFHLWKLTYHDDTFFISTKKLGRPPIVVLLFYKINQFFGLSDLHIWAQFRVMRVFINACKNAEIFRQIITFFHYFLIILKLNLFLEHFFGKNVKEFYNPQTRRARCQNMSASERAPEPKQITQPLTTPIGCKGKCRLALFKSYYNSIVLRAAGRNL